MSHIHFIWHINCYISILYFVLLVAYLFHITSYVLRIHFIFHVACYISISHFYFILFHIKCGTSISYYLSHIPSYFSQAWAAGICAGVSFIHDCGYVHQDLKSSNILVFADRTVKVCDFGLARKKPDTTMLVDRELCTLWYRAPVENTILRSQLSSTYKSYDQWLSA